MKRRFWIFYDVSDRDCLRFLWVDDVSNSNSSVVVYQFCRVVFGLNVSPFLLNGTIRHHLATFAEADPEFVRKMFESFYVDDMVSFRRRYKRQSVRSVQQGEGQNGKRWVQTETKQETVRRLEDEETFAK